MHQLAFTDGSLMKVESIAEFEHSTISLTTLGHFLVACFCHDLDSSHKEVLHRSTFIV